MRNMHRLSLHGSMPHCNDWFPSLIYFTDISIIVNLRLEFLSHKFVIQEYIAKIIHPDSESMRGLGDLKNLFRLSSKGIRSPIKRPACSNPPATAPSMAQVPTAVGIDRSKGHEIVSTKQIFE